MTRRDEVARGEVSKLRQFNDFKLESARAGATRTRHFPGEKFGRDAIISEISAKKIERTL